MAFTIIYDANVFFPAPLRDLLIRVALTDIVRARWTDEILDECFRNVFAQRPDLSEESLRRTRELMNRAIRDGLVTGYEPLIAGPCSAVLQAVAAGRRWTLGARHRREHAASAGRGVRPGRRGEEGLLMSSIPSRMLAPPQEL